MCTIYFPVKFWNRNSSTPNLKPNLTMTASIFLALLSSKELGKEGHLLDIWSFAKIYGIPGAVEASTKTELWKVSLSTVFKICVCTCEKEVDLLQKYNFLCILIAHFLTFRMLLNIWGSLYSKLCTVQKLNISYKKRSSRMGYGNLGKLVKPASCLRPFSLFVNIISAVLPIILFQMQWKLPNFVWLFKIWGQWFIATLLAPFQQVSGKILSLNSKLSSWLCDHNSPERIMKYFPDNSIKVSHHSIWP